MCLGILVKAPNIDTRIRDIRPQAFRHFFQIFLELISKLFCLIHCPIVNIGLILLQCIIPIGAAEKDFYAVTTLFIKSRQAVKHKVVSRQPV